MSDDDKTTTCGTDQIIIGPSLHLNYASGAVVSEPKPLRMSAYYYAFEPTGVELVDRVLSAVASAGKSYHHTDSWNDEIENPECYGPFRGKSVVDWIQNAAFDAAQAISLAESRLTEQIASWLENSDEFRVSSLDTEAMAAAIRAGKWRK